MINILGDMSNIYTYTNTRAFVCIYIPPVYTLTCIINQSKFIGMQEGEEQRIRLYFYTTHGYLFKREFAETYSVCCSRCKHERASPLEQTRRMEKKRARLYTRRCPHRSGVPFPVARKEK